MLTRRATYFGGMAALAGAFALAGGWYASAKFAPAPARTCPLGAPIETCSWAAHEDAASAHLERSLEPNGGERLQGTARYRVQGALSWVRAVELVNLDAEGRLRSAEVRLSYGDAAAARRAGLADRVLLDAGKGQVTVLQLDGKSESHRVPVDLPWVYQPISLPGGGTVNTPVSMSVALRAARARRAVRLVTRRAFDPSVMSDQISIKDSRSRWIVMGDDLADFVEEGATPTPTLHTLRVAALGLELNPKESPICCD